MPSNEGSFCYHCYAVGNCVDECPECAGKPWSEEFLTAKAEIDEELANLPPNRSSVMTTPTSRTAARRRNPKGHN